MSTNFAQKFIAAKWIVAYIATFAFSMTLFMYTAPWLGAQPIEELSISNLAYNPPPAGTQTFWNNHGQAVFSKRGLAPFVKPVRNQKENRHHRRSGHSILESSGARSEFQPSIQILN